ncbi:PI-PLC X domain-containing protein 1 isoform X2 [Corythoichthys intestinalis]|uniref:PI-PLC X domain-containing protein 1 isoform X2 n=1 Tax=Corythoichthys intestinalis TaxID=161448 RepID=UPI0025A526F2|nr:PI-PLC X domain-containing protein 1 isoform X2 [Corythoichthys intestinalis]
MKHKMGDKLPGNANWMSRLPEELLDVPLWNLAIPGSHDSMSFCLDTSSPVVESESWFLKVMDRLAPCCTRPCVLRWATTQQTVLSSQCELGVRFLDMRIAKKPKECSKLFFAHGIYTWITVKDCATLRSCWSRHQQIIVSYDNQDMVNNHPQLWTDIPYWYADSTDPKKVIAYLEAQKHAGRPSCFFVSGLNLTETVPFVLLHPFENMRKITTKALTVLLGWVREQQPGPEVDGVNIICCDFVGASNFCDCVIRLNYKGRC